MTTQGWIFLAIAAIAYLAIHKKWILKKTKVSNWPWYGKVLTIFFAVGLLYAIADLLIAD